MLFRSVGKCFCRVDNPELKNFQLIVDECTNYSELLNKRRLFEDGYLEKSPKDNINVKRCFLFFYEAFKTIIDDSLDSIDELTKIRNKIIDLDVIDIKATNQQESYNIFEILNARGVDLKSHELIKNYILKYIRPKSNIDAAKLIWNDLEKTLFVDNKDVMELFFEHYVTHRYSKPNKDNSEFRIIRGNCNKNEMSLLLDDMCQKAKIYRWFYMPDECNNVIIKGVLQFFNERNHRQFRPVFLSLISAYNKENINKDTLEKTMIWLKNFYFAFGLVCNMTSNTIENAIYDSAVEIETKFTSSSIDNLINKLSKHYPSYDKFNVMFKNIGYSKVVKAYATPNKKKIVQYILKCYEDFFQSNNSELTVNSLTIEHIGNDDGSDSHCRIGNLLPLSEPINNNAGSKAFLEKIDYYKSSNFITVKNFVNYYGDKVEWTHEYIEKRADYMANLAYNDIWKL